VDGQRVLYANRPKGIFKPKQMSAALSIKTGVPRQGRPTWYRDQQIDSASLDGATGLLRDGALLEGLKGLDGTRLRLPEVRGDWPMPDYLERRFARYRETLG